jgi:hypothetical protein
MDRRVNIPWVGGSLFHGKGVMISWVGVQYTMSRDLIYYQERFLYTMVMGFDMP